MEITSSFFLPDNEITVTFVRSSDPGGQNVNKVATAVQLRFDVRNSPSLVEEVKAKLIQIAGKRVSSDGILVIEAKHFREQERNRADAELRLALLIQKALVRPKKRRATKPSASARSKRVETKKRRGEIKRIRQSRLNHDA